MGEILALKKVDIWKKLHAYLESDISEILNFK